MTAPPARERSAPPAPPDRRPPRRGGGSSPSASAAGRAAGVSRPVGARRGQRERSARALAAAALLALAGALALPATAQAQTATTLVSNIGQGTDTTVGSTTYAQRFTIGSDAAASMYTLTGVDIASGGNFAFTAKVCGVDSSGFPTSTCTDLSPPGTFAAGTMSFTAPANTSLERSTTYTVSMRPVGGGGFFQFGRTANDAEDTGKATGWTIGNSHDFINTSTNAWDIHATRSIRIAINGSAAGGGTPTCTLNTGDLWCGVVTVAAISSGGSVAAHGFAGTDGGLEDKTFSVGTNNYTIDGLYVGTAGDLNLDLTGALDAADKGNLKLVVGSTDFDLDDATHVSSENAYLWTGTGLDWSSDAHVTLRLRRAVALSTDATLSGLTVYDGSSNLTLSPSFASAGTEPYTASAAYDIATVTVTATKNQADATVAWLDASDATLADADAMASGHQVALEAGGNTFKVKVTAEDGTTTKTYTVTVNRATPTCSLNTGDLWCGVVTVGHATGYDGYAANSSFGALSDSTFSVGTNSYTIEDIYVQTGGFSVGALTFVLVSGLTSADKAALVLHLGSAEFEFSDAPEAAGRSYTWSNAGLDWSSESFVTLRLRDTPVANNAPVFSPTSTTREVEENSAAGTNVGAVIPEATDSDSGDTLTYSMEGTDAASFDFDASTRQITTITGVTYNYEATKNSYSVTVRASDGTASATIAVTINVTDVNEKSAKPDKPTLAKVTGSSTTLTATWTKPDLDGGPDIATYIVQYREGTTGVWTTEYNGNALTTTITGLTADTSYQVQVRANNGEVFSDWSDASDAVKTNAAAVAPTISAVAVTSTPVLETDTYGAGETIEVSVTFDEAVNATSDTDFVLSVAGAKRAPLVRGSGTATLVFGYTVVPGDEDDNGIWIGDQDRTLVGNRDGDPQNGTITSVATSTAADLTHAELGQQSGHKVDGSRSIVSVAVSSTPMLATDTYGAGETIRFTVTFNVAVDVSGDPVLTFALGNQGQVRDVDAAHEGGGGSTALVFAYTVVSTDEDNNGIYLKDEQDFNNPDGPVRLDSDDTIRFAGTSTDVPLYWQGRGTQSGHKVDGSRTTGNTAPVFADASVTREVAENSAVGTSVGAVVTATDADNDTLTYSLEGTDAASFEIDSGTGQIKTVTGVTYNFEATKNSYSVTVKASDGTASDTIAVTIDVTDVNEKSAKPDKPTLAAVTGSSTSLTATWTKPGLNGGPDIAGYAVQYREGTTGTWTAFAHTGSGLTTTITGLTADTSYQVRVRAKNGETDSDWSDASDAVRTNAVDIPIPPGLVVTLHLSDEDGSVLENHGRVTVTATASPASPVPFTVTVSADPVAPATEDDFRLSTNRVLSFAANATESTGTVTIRPVDDDDPEPPDVVTVSGAVSNAAIADPDDVTLTILNEDSDVRQDVAIDAPAAVEEDAGTAVVTVTLTTRQNIAPVIDVQLYYYWRQETATRGEDYRPPPGRVFVSNVLFATVPPSAYSPNAAGTAWVAQRSFTIGIVDDREAEGDETIVFRVETSSDQSPNHTIAIRDDDTPVLRNVRLVSGPGSDGEWRTGEQVEVEVRYSLPVVVERPDCWLLNADGTCRPPGPYMLVAFRSDARPGYGEGLSAPLAPYEGGSGTDTLRFAYTVGAAEDGARGAWWWGTTACSCAARRSVRSGAGTSSCRSTRTRGCCRSMWRSGAGACGRRATRYGWRSGSRVRCSIRPPISRRTGTRCLWTRGGARRRSACCWGTTSTAVCRARRGTSLVRGRTPSRSSTR